MIFFIMMWGLFSIGRKRVLVMSLVTMINLCVRCSKWRVVHWYGTGCTTNHAVVIVVIDNSIISFHGRNELSYACRHEKKNCWCCHDGPCAGYCRLRGHESAVCSLPKLTSWCLHSYGAAWNKRFLWRESHGHGVDVTWCCDVVQNFLQEFKLFDCSLGREDMVRTRSTSTSYLWYHTAYLPLTILILTTSSHLV